MPDTKNEKKTYGEVLDSAQQGGHAAMNVATDGIDVEAPHESEWKEKLSTTLREKEEVQEKLLRLAAEYENYKRRAIRDVEDARFQIKDRLLRELLPVLDGLDMALEAAQPSQGLASAQSLLDGVKMVQKQFLAALERFDITSIDAFEKPFDPQQHEAVQQIPAGSLAPGIVAKVLRRGFISGTRLLRPAMVIVTMTA